MYILIISDYSSRPSHCIPTEHGDVYPHYQRLFWPGSNSFVHLTYIYRRKNFTFFFSEARLFTVRYAWFSVCSSSLTLNWTQRIISVAELLKAPGLFNFRGCERSSSGSRRKRRRLKLRNTENNWKVVLHEENWSAGPGDWRNRVLEVTALALPIKTFSSPDLQNIVCKFSIQWKILN